MKIVIFSDSHDNMPNIATMVVWAKSNAADCMIGCGDLCTVETLQKGFVEQWDKELHLVFGNAGQQQEQILALADENTHIHHHEQQGSAEFDAVCIGFTHYPDDARRMAESGEYEYVFYGHTHKPWEEQVGNCMVVNPGTLAGLFYKPTFAVFDTQTKMLELLLLEQLMQK